MGYHVAKIPRGEFGEFSKIEEEFLELKDAHDQGNSVMLLCEMSDLLGAIEAYAANWGISLNKLILMKEATARAFKDGSRT
jgi:hypothetical protein